MDFAYVQIEPGDLFIVREYTNGPVVKVMLVKTKPTVSNYSPAWPMSSTSNASGQELFFDVYDVTLGKKSTFRQTPINFYSKFSDGIYEVVRRKPR